MQPLIQQKLQPRTICTLTITSMNKTVKTFGPWRTFSRRKKIKENKHNKYVCYIVSYIRICLVPWRTNRDGDGVYRIHWVRHIWLSFIWATCLWDRKRKYLEFLDIYIKIANEFKTTFTCKDDCDKYLYISNLDFKKPLLNWKFKEKL